MTVAEGWTGPTGPAPVGLGTLAWLCRAIYALDLADVPKGDAEAVRWFGAYLAGAGVPRAPERPRRAP